MSNLKVIGAKDSVKFVMSSAQVLYAILAGIVAIFLLGCGAVLFINETTASPKTVDAVTVAIKEVRDEGRKDLAAAEERMLQRRREAVEEHDKIRNEFLNEVKSIRAEAKADRRQIDDKFERIMERLPPKRLEISGIQ